eukprot:5984882-Amphidinium_carterae.1
MPFKPWHFGVNVLKCSGKECGGKRGGSNGDAKKETTQIKTPKEGSLSKQQSLSFFHISREI